MAEVFCEVVVREVQVDVGFWVMCTFATCERCGHETMSRGDSEGSANRCLALMREECPEAEHNFYAED